ncbi:MAG: RNase H family protein [Chitinophagales bacterium]
MNIKTSKFVWVKGHSTNKENNRCDELATQAADGFDLAIDEFYESELKIKMDFSNLPIECIIPIIIF